MQAAISAFGGSLCFSDAGGNSVSQASEIGLSGGQHRRGNLIEDAPVLAAGSAWSLWSQLCELMESVAALFTHKDTCVGTDRPQLPWPILMSR